MRTTSATATSATATSPGIGRALVGFLVVACVSVVALVGVDTRSDLRPWKAVVLGAVEGLTEYLPVSSTAHLLVTARLFGLGDGSDGSALGTYVIALQVGAIAAVPDPLPAACGPDRWRPVCL